MNDWEKLGVKLARKTIEDIFSGKNLKEIIESFKELLPKEKMGVFVSIHTYPEYELRGCIGFPEPVYPLYEALPRASFYAAFEDSRFRPLNEPELNNVVFEVSYLTKPILLQVKNPMEYLEKIKIGKHGLIVEKGFNKGLLLPQVPIEQNWNAEEFLCYTCLKAGLTPDSWLDKETKIYVFEAKIFMEKDPKGEVIEKKLI